ncbi:hypothetical protein B0A55_05931 [Friedmanniomyces simplex]|uniref:DUF1989 domain-containing protein n=1 Tax=Friedmanniomyces simplex TaxID=329884 RepID=A0A4U0XF42_9PEZI|nr:hypothetical protein B0A55_05931 [Friedmanniomyces simplex]
MASPNNTATPKTQIVPAAHGFAFEVKKGEKFRIVDLYGEQVVDFAAWVQGTELVEKLSMAYTRYHLSGVTPAIGEYLWTNKDEPLLQLIDDTCHVHDMTFMSCFPEMYAQKGLPTHRSCAGNMAEVMKPHGMRSHLEVTDPFNIFQNTPNYSLKRLGSSKPGDQVTFMAMRDYETCGDVAAQYGIQLSAFEADSAADSDSCRDLLAGYRICLATTSSSTSTTPISTTTSSNDTLTLSSPPPLNTSAPTSTRSTVITSSTTTLTYTIGTGTSTGVRTITVVHTATELELDNGFYWQCERIFDKLCDEFERLFDDLRYRFKHLLDRPLLDKPLLDEQSDHK